MDPLTVLDRISILISDSSVVGASVDLYHRCFFVLRREYTNLNMFLESWGVEQPP